MFNRNNFPNTPNLFGNRNPQQTPHGYDGSPRGDHRSSDPRQQQQRGPPMQQPGRPFGIAKVPDQTWVFQNLVAANPGDFRDETYVIIDGKFVVTARSILGFLSLHTFGIKRRLNG